MQRKFIVEVTRIDEYEVTVDDEIWNKKQLENWGEAFWKLDGPEELAESLAENAMRQGAGSGYMEGYGIVKTLFTDGSEKTQWEGLKKVEENDYTKGLLLRIIEEDDYQTEYREVKEK